MIHRYLSISEEENTRNNEIFKIKIIASNNGFNIHFKKNNSILNETLYQNTRQQQFPHSHNLAQYR